MSADPRSRRPGLQLSTRMLPSWESLADVAVMSQALVACRAAVISPAAIADAQTAARVKTALVNDPDLGPRAIEVRVAGGVARLSGRVRTRGEVERAEALARGVAGVLDVIVNLQVGADAPDVPEAPAARPAPPDDALLETQPGPGLVSIGAAIGWSAPTAGALGTRLAVGPIVRLGSGRGAGLAIGFDWVTADLQSIPGAEGLTRVHIRPIMLGLRYTVGPPRISFSPSLVAGYAFNSVTVMDTGLAQGVAVDADNSLAWRPGASVWYDASRRFALKVSAGYLMTGLRVTVFEDGRLARRRVRGDTALVQAGIAYRLF